MGDRQALLVEDVLVGIFALPRPLHDPTGFLSARCSPFRCL
jgi:hypothetical protein